MTKEIEMQCVWCKETVYQFDHHEAICSVRRTWVPEKGDNVSSPSHYTAFPGIEVIQLTRHLNFNRGNAIKYLARAGKKTKDGEPSPTVQGDLEDIKKALWYVADECQRLGVSAEEIARIVAPHAGHGAK